MSLFGKILAILNIFGAAGLVYLATMDYSKRQAWAYNRLRNEIILTGLPLDDAEQAPNGATVVGLFGDYSLGLIFKPVGGDPVRTQLQEVGRVKDKLDAKILAAEKDKRTQTLLLARILLPLADDHLEREQLLACRWHLATEPTAAAFKKRYLDAFREAVKPPPAGEEKPMTFEQAFRTAVRAQGGQPSEAFTSLLVKALPDDRAKAKGVDIAKVFDDVAETQRQQLVSRYGSLFATALTGPVPGAVKKAADAADAQEAAGKQLTDDQKKLVAEKRRPIEAQKAYVAQLLTGLCLFLAEDAIDANPTLAPRVQPLPHDGAAYGQALVDSNVYRNMIKRVQVVCGLRAALDAFTADTVVLRKLAEGLDATVAEERQQFVADHTVIVEQIRQRAALLQQELAHKAESERKLTVQEELVKKRKVDVKQAEDEYAELRSKTAESAAALRKITQDLLNDRVKNRDLIRLAEESEKAIRELEKKIRELESER